MSDSEKCPQCGEFHLDCECNPTAKRVLPCHRIDLGGGIPLLVIGDSIEGETLEITLGRPLEAKGE